MEIKNNIKLVKVVSVAFIYALAFLGNPVLVTGANKIVKQGKSFRIFGGWRMTRSMLRAVKVGVVHGVP